MNKIIKKKVTILVTLVAISVLAAMLIVGFMSVNKNQYSNNMSANIALNNDNNSVLSDMSDSASTFSFGGISKHYTSGEKMVYIRIDARDTMFGDDVVLDFSCNVSVTVSFSVDFMLSGAVRKTRSWTGSGTSGGQILNSGMTKIDKIVVRFTLDNTITYTESFLQF